MKFNIRMSGYGFALSLPSRERGLKFCSTVEYGIFNSSLPSRERGLKYPTTSHHPAQSIVAPLAGAWIEILYNSLIFILFTVAPLAGAWIEISASFTDSVLAKMSLPSRERGLKSFAPINCDTNIVSLPSRERGLKSAIYDIIMMSKGRSPRGSVD